jgi:hypothetical protein
MWIHNDESGSYAGYCEGWSPVSSRRQLHGEQPDLFLIAKKISWQVLPRGLSDGEFPRGTGDGLSGRLAVLSWAKADLAGPKRQKDASKTASGHPPTHRSLDVFL